MLVVSIQCLVIYRILVSRPNYQGLGLGLETWWPRSCSWSRDLLTKVLVLVSRPVHQGLGLGLETWWPRSWSWSRVFFKGLDNKSADLNAKQHINKILTSAASTSGYSALATLRPTWISKSNNTHSNLVRLASINKPERQGKTWQDLSEKIRRTSDLPMEDEGAIELAGKSERNLFRAIRCSNPLLICEVGN